MAQFLVLSLGSIAKSLLWRPILQQADRGSPPAPHPDVKASFSMWCGNERIRTLPTHSEFPRCSSTSGYRRTQSPRKVLCGCKRRQRHLCASNGPFGTPHHPREPPPDCTIKAPQPGTHHIAPDIGLNVTTRQMVSQPPVRGMPCRSLSWKACRDCNQSLIGCKQKNSRHHENALHTRILVSTARSSGAECKRLGTTVTA